MKRTVVLLGLLGLVWATPLHAASVPPLYQDDFSTDKLLKDPSTYVQGFGTSERNDPTAVPWYIHDGYLSSISPDLSIISSDGTGVDENTPPLDPPSVPFMLLTGDPTWADVAVQIKMYSYDQNTGTFAVILRATPKTKPTDPDSWYQFTYQTYNTVPGDVSGQATNEGITPDQAASGILPITGTPALRIMKVVNNKWKLLAETDNVTSKDHIPEVNVAGADHDASGGGDMSNPTGATFRFVAKGNVLQAFCALPGKPFIKYLEVTDDDLKAGKVGLTHCDYDPIFDDLLVENAP